MAYVLAPLNTTVFESQLFFLADRRALPGHQRCVSGADAAHNVASLTSHLPSALLVLSNQECLLYLMDTF
jgi:hypothetical protein